MSEGAPLGGAPAPTARLGHIADRRLHPAYLLISAGETLRGLLPVVIGISVWRTHWWILAIAGVLVVALSVARWSTKTYSVTRGVLSVRSGVFKRSVDTIASSRITALDAYRGVVQRLFRVWALKVQTPGDGDRASVRLACLSSSALDDIRSALQPVPVETVVPEQFDSEFRREASHLLDDPAPLAEPGSPGLLVAKLGPRELLVAAITGTSIPLLFLGAAAAWNRLNDLLPEHTLRRLTREAFGGSWLIIAAGIALAVLVGVAVVSLRLANFTVVRDGQLLRISRGLFAQRAGTVRVDRIQAIRVVEGLWRLPLGYCTVEVEVAGLSSRKDNERLLFPLLRTSRVAEFVERAVPDMHWPLTPLTPVPTRAQRRYLTIPVTVAVLVTAALLLLPGRWAVLAAGPLPISVLVGLGQANDAAWRIDADTTTFRWRRILARHTVVARTARVQLTSLTVNFWQRRTGLAGIRISLSSKRRAGIRHLDAADAAGLLHQVGRRPPIPAGRG